MLTGDPLGRHEVWMHEQIESSTFTQNAAKSSGSVLLADDDSQISILDSTMSNNGNYSCYDPPTVSDPTHTSMSSLNPGSLQVRQLILKWCLFHAHATLRDMTATV